MPSRIHITGNVHFSDSSTIEGLYAFLHSFLVVSIKMFLLYNILQVYKVLLAALFNVAQM